MGRVNSSYLNVNFYLTQNNLPLLCVSFVVHSPTNVGHLFWL